VKVGALTFVLLTWLPLQAAIAKDNCQPLRKFVASVQPGETRSFAFRTNWGGSFKDEETTEQGVFYSKRCEHHDYAPAKAACAYFMAHGPVEFADENLKLAVNCLSRESHLEDVSFDSAVLSLHYGNENRGATVDLEFVEDPQVGGMVLRVTASGY
jgi:hypothetical protein